MERWQFIRWGIAASVLAHFLIAGGIVVSTTVRPYDIPRPDEVAVDIVDADEPQKTPDPVATPSPSPELTLPQPAPSPSPAAAAPPPIPQPSQEAKETSKPPSPSPSPAPAQQPSPVPSPKAAAKSAAKSDAKSDAKSVARAVPTPTPVPAPSYVPPEPDITVKYGVRLGLPEPLAPLPTGIGPDDKEVGSNATKALAGDLDAALRQRFRTCAHLPASLSRSDDVFVKLVLAIRPDGRLAAEPELLGGPSDPEKAEKALQLKQSVVAALEACQPYAMLPPDRYGEWKVLEMSFRPQDFGG
ncbi:hypothetical protein LQG66_08290 [Bradyrhizobium ontarionense]|uniref:Cell envelope biogenesis protein TolA n=1 Tax=Bradyrhizobium ontarionense TaxID=2898149 RepID=A0ABY3RH60_9BRAD|nr:hypothetical protein [Bradyrhizobium sp. A19]UFZ06285.1 hypothetical protein LQG66_08290 [Bradyrhizobium sp. A19]